MENYCKTINIEALTMSDMVKKDILPAVFAYSKDLTDMLAAKKAIGVDISKDAAAQILEALTDLSGSLYEQVEALDEAIATANGISELLDKAKYYKDTVIKCMTDVRAVADQLETIVGAEYWPFPTYGDLLFRI